MTDWGLDTFVYGSDEATTFGPAFSDDLKKRMNEALENACKKEGISRAEVAHRMSQFLGVKISEGYINQYVSPSASDKQINVTRFIAFIHATKAVELLGILTAPFDLRVVSTKHAKLIERELLKERLKALEADIENADQEYRGAS